MKPCYLAILFLGIALSGCQSNPDPAETAIGENTSTTQAQRSADDETIWAFLRNKYDTDRDGAVSQEEYDRKGGQFERLDRNKDGILDAADFESKGRSSRENMMNGMLAQRMVIRYFQEDDNQELPLSEMERSADIIDTSHDGVVDAKEFATHAQTIKFTDDSSPMATMMKNRDPWKLLLAGVDKNKDSLVAKTELVAFFKARDDGDGIWRTRKPRSAKPREGRTVAKRGAQVGSMAPDFTLDPPKGGAPVTLSHFINKKPVALIFGSYT